MEEQKTTTEEDPLFQLLSGTWMSLREEYAHLLKDSIWDNTPFRDLHKHSNKRKGTTVGERMIRTICVTFGMAFTDREASQHDVVINGVRVEAKLALLQSPTPRFTFNQLRRDDGEFNACLGIAPDAVYLWTIPREVIIAKAAEDDKNGVGNQHGDRTFVLSFNPLKPHDWLRPYGGRGVEGLRVFRKYLEKPRA